MKALITGSGGFIGGHLVEHLLAAGYAVHATDTVAAAGSAPVQAPYEFATLDILDRRAVRQCLEYCRPDVLFHLAAQSYPGVSWEKPALTFEVNVNGTVNLLEGVRELGLNTVLVVVCSSALYASDSAGAPIAEDAPQLPSNPYGISKLAQDHVTRLYAERYGMKAMRIRPFFLVGTRKKGDVSSDFARGIVAIERGRADCLKVGNLDVVRDMLDVRDGVAAFRLVAERGQAGAAYNICTGSGCRLRQVLEVYTRLALKPVRVEVDPARIRPLDEMVRIGDATRLKALGWAPRFSLEQSLRDILEYWRANEP